MRLREGALAVMCLGAAVGCGGSGSSAGGPPTFQVKATGTGASASQTAQGLTRFTSSDGTEVTLTAARVNLREIRLALSDGTRCADVAAELTAPATCEDGSSSAELRIAGPVVVDLLTGASTPDLSAVHIPAGTYRRVELRVDDTDDSQALASDDPLRGMSFVASAAFTDSDGVARQLQLALNFNEDHRVEPAGGVSVSADGGELLLTLDAQKWLSGIPVSSCLAAGDLATDGDTVFLDERSQGSCGDVENVLKDNIKGSEQVEAH